MSAIKVSATARQGVCSVTKSGIGLPQSLVEKTGWKQGRDRIAVGFIPLANCLLLSKPTQSEQAFLLSYSNTSTRSGGKIACQAFIRNYLKAIIVLPQKGIRPILVDHRTWQVALILGEVSWSTVEFSQAGYSKVPKNTIGVYQLVEKDGQVIRIGEGTLATRLNAHLREYAQFPGKVYAFRYLELAEKEDCEILEKALIAMYELETGAIPPHNKIRA